MLKLEYDNSGRIVLPMRRCYKRVPLSTHAETYCMMLEGHKGKCLPPAPRTVAAPAPIPCTCLDCKMKAKAKDAKK